MELMALPVVGARIYISTLESCGVNGGLTTVQAVIPEANAIVISIFPGATFNWDVLGPIQDDLRNKFGQTEASLMPDFEEKKRQRQNSCPL